MEWTKIICIGGASFFTDYWYKKSCNLVTQIFAMLATWNYDFL